MKREVLEALAFTTRVPKETGKYLVACDETDFEPDFVAVKRDEYGMLVVDDPNIGTFDLKAYHDNLTDIHWYRTCDAS